MAPLKRLFVVLLVVAWIPAAATAADAPTATAPSKFIEGMADKAIAALTEKGIPRPDRITRFRALLNDHFDVKTIGRWVLGRYWQTATPAEREEYLALFEDLLVATYVDRFTEYSGETINVVKSEDVGNGEAVVSSRIARTAGDPPIRVDWRLRQREGQFRIVDVVVEGISMGMAQRSEFASVVSQNGGTLEGLLSKLREKRKHI
ncbi:MAG: ABC transporter substrate-binding protein [Rhodospirillales bacterium]|nr:ABC transporter substrate-binding protein [Rhodospirillales bacterium]